MGLGDLKSQLLKAGLVDKKQIQTVGREKKKARKKKGRKGVEAEKQAKQDRLAAEAAERRQADRERELAKQERDTVREEALRVAQIAKSGALKPKSRPNRRWYYISRDDRVPFISIDDDLGRRLERGSAALVESPDGEAWPVGRETAERLKPLDASWIRCWHTKAR